MTRRALIPALMAVAFCVQAHAQEPGGLRLAPNINGGPVGLARQLPFTPTPFVTAHDLQNGMTAADHQAKNQSMIGKLRGDAGFLSGFSLGTPLAASRQQMQVQALPDDAGYRARQHHRSGPVIINNQGPLAVTVGDGNVVQQQSAMGAGPIAQQQVATQPSAGSRGAVNLVTGGGNIVQRAP